MSFCRDCGCHLFLHAPVWAGKVYPWATAVDTELPRTPETFHINLDLAAPWVEVPSGTAHRSFDSVPPDSIEEWHRRHELYED